MPRIWRLWADARDRASAAQRRAALATDYRVTFATEHGQRVLADILIRAGVAQTSFRVGDGADAAAFREGQRYAALQIIEMINATPDAALRLSRTGDTEELFHDAV